MRLVFIDDSQQTNPPRDGLGRLLAIGGVIVPEEQLAGFAADMSAIKADLGIPVSEEIKWKPPKGSFLAGAGGEVAQALRQQMLEAAFARDIRSIVVMVDHSQVYTSRTDAEVGREILKWLYERVSIALAKEGDVGLVIADKPGGGSAEEGRWLADSLSLTNDGTEYVEPGNVVLPIVTAPSHHVPHLQLADLIVAACTAAVAGHPAALALRPLLRQLFHRNAVGDAGGAGIVIFPARPNLYHWAFGEDSYSKVGMNTGWTLPWREWKYATEDGLGGELRT